MPQVVIILSNTESDIIDIKKAVPAQNQIFDILRIRGNISKICKN